MIDYNNIVKYNRTQNELEELIIFCICVAGKSAKTIAPRVHKLCGDPPTGFTPLEYLSWIEWNSPNAIRNRLQGLGVGCYSQKAKTILDLLNARLDLEKCPVSDLEKIKGIGPKTSRFFVMSSRRDVQHAALDTHLLKFLADSGVENVPKSTPSGKKYLTLEQTYLKMVPKGKTPAEWDLEIWKRYVNRR